MTPGHLRRITKNSLDRYNPKTLVPMGKATHAATIARREQEGTSVAAAHIAMGTQAGTMGEPWPDMDGREPKISAQLSFKS